MLRLNGATCYAEFLPIVGSCEVGSCCYEAEFQVPRKLRMIKKPITKKQVVGVTGDPVGLEMQSLLNHHRHVKHGYYI